MSLSTCFVDPYSSGLLLLAGAILAYKCWFGSKRFEFFSSAGLLFLISSAISSLLVPLVGGKLLVMVHNMLIGAFAASIPLIPIQLADTKEMSEKAVKARARILFKLPILGALVVFTLINYDKLTLLAPVFALLLSVGVLFLGSSKVTASYRRSYLGSIFIILIATILRYYVGIFGEAAYYVSGALFALPMIVLAAINGLMTRNFSND